MGKTPDEIAESSAQGSNRPTGQSDQSPPQSADPGDLREADPASAADGTGAADKASGEWPLFGRKGLFRT